MTTGRPKLVLLYSSTAVCRHRKWIFLLVPAAGQLANDEKVSRSLSVANPKFTPGRRSPSQWFQRFAFKKQGFAMARCDHFNVCNREPLKDGKCVLHSPAGVGEAFDRALEKHVEKYGPDFRHMIIPQAHPSLLGPTFKERARFRGSTLEDTTFLKGASFKQGANFADSTFCDQAFLGHSTFGANTSFRGAVFEGGVDFKNAIFEGTASFTGARFQKAGFEIEGADFMGALFQGDVLFCRSVFCDAAHLTATFERSVDLEDATFEAYVNLAGRFHGEVRFLRSEFRGDVDFRGAQFSECPVFAQCTFSGDLHLG